MGASARVTPPFTISTLHRFHRTQLPRLPLHDGRVLTRAAQEPLHNHPTAQSHTTGRSRLHTCAFAQPSALAFTRARLAQPSAHALPVHALL